MGSGMLRAGGCWAGWRRRAEAGLCRKLVLFSVRREKVARANDEQNPACGTTRAGQEAGQRRGEQMCWWWSEAGNAVDIPSLLGGQWEERRRSRNCCAGGRGWSSSVLPFVVCLKRARFGGVSLLAGVGASDATKRGAAEKNSDVLVDSRTDQLHDGTR